MRLAGRGEGVGGSGAAGTGARGCAAPARRALHANPSLTVAPAPRDALRAPQVEVHAIDKGGHLLRGAQQDVGVVGAKLGQQRAVGGRGGKVLGAVGSPLAEQPRVQHGRVGTCAGQVEEEWGEESGRRQPTCARHATRMPAADARAAPVAPCRMHSWRKASSDWSTMGATQYFGEPSPRNHSHAASACGTASAGFWLAPAELAIA